MNERDISKLKDLIKKAFSAKSGDEQREAYKQIGELICDAAYMDGLTIHNIDTWDNERIEV